MWYKQINFSNIGRKRFKYKDLYSAITQLIQWDIDVKHKVEYHDGEL